MFPSTLFRRVSRAGDFLSFSEAWQIFFLPRGDRVDCPPLPGPLTRNGLLLPPPPFYLPVPRGSAGYSVIQPQTGHAPPWIFSSVSRKFSYVFLQSCFPSCLLAPSQCFLLLLLIWSVFWFIIGFDWKPPPWQPS